MTGTLFGIGLGPGAPDLMTLRAHRLISAAQVIAYPAPDSGESFARSIAADAIPADAVEIPMIVPMRVERFPAQEVYADAAVKITAHLDAGKDVVVLCEGDPFFYGSFMYLFARLSKAHPVEIVPGVSSLAGCTAAVPQPLVARNDVLTVLPGPLPDGDLRARIDASDAVAIMKVGRHLGRLKALLSSMDLLDHAKYVERATLENQRVLPLCEADESAPYFSMILITKGSDPWLNNAL
ncbi:MAG: precorrin-2 C(20)-methyltransferase [Pseudomonadota bacterium]